MQGKCRTGKKGREPSFFKDTKKTGIQHVAYMSSRGMWDVFYFSTNPEKRKNRLLQKIKKPP
jgi:hypothetical protein